MYAPDQKLADWTAAYSRLKDARAKLNGFGARVTPAMRAEVAHCQREAERALEAMQREIELFKKEQHTWPPYDGSKAVTFKLTE